MRRIAQLLSIGYIVLAVVLAGLELRPPPQPITIQIAYGTEKEDWLQEAANRFLASNPTVNGRAIEIDLEGQGSREMMVSTWEGELQATVLSPASSIHLELLRDEWQTRNNDSILFDGDDAPQPLVITPLVLVAWEERAQVLALDDPDQLWENLHRLVANPQGWGAFERPEWGFANLGHTDPESSNSGLQAIVLLAYAYHDKTSGLGNEDILDTDFQAWFTEFENAVPEFIHSTGTLMTDMLLYGQSKYDFVIVYENLAIDNFEVAEGRGGAIRVYYPPANILSDHPYAILNAPWVTDDQRAAAARFREFLLAEETQQLALQFGFRPANPAVPFDTPDSPFNRFAENGIQTNIAQSVEVPPASVLQELLEVWRRGDFE